MVPSLCSGVTWAVFQAVGKLPEARQRLNTWVKWSIIDGAASFSAVHWQDGEEVWMVAVCGSYRMLRVSLTVNQMAQQWPTDLYLILFFILFYFIFCCIVALIILSYSFYFNPCGRSLLAVWSLSLSQDTANVSFSLPVEQPVFQFQQQPQVVQSGECFSPTVLHTLK